MMMTLAILAAAPRVLSADFCADQYVLALADRTQIAALSVDAEKDFSYLRARAAGRPQARPEAEEIVARDVDVVLRHWGGDGARLERAGAAIVTLAYAADFDAVRDNIRTAAGAIHQRARGAALIQALDDRLEALAARGKTGVAALYLTPGAVTAGKDTMIDAIFSAAGVRNIAAAQGLSYWPALSVERLALDPPAFVVTGFFGADSERVNHWSLARHPAFRKALAATPRVDLAADTLACPGWFALDAAERLRDAVDAMEHAHD